MFISDRKTDTAVDGTICSGEIRTGTVRTASSVNERNETPQLQDRDLRTGFIYMIISVILMIAGAVYEHFSFGVYSYFMIYAFAIPLAGGALPFLVKYMIKLRRDEEPGNSCDPSSSCSTEDGSDHRPELIYHMALATLTVGSIVHGILAICGRPNSLTVIYLIAGLLLLAVTALGVVRSSAIHMQK